MKLFYNRPSPYARKVRVVAHEKRLLDRMERIEVDPWADPPALLAVSPIGKVPVLVTDDGVVITESLTIAEHLDAVGEGPSLLAGDRTAVLARAALVQGVIDAAFVTVLERRRPAERQWPDWVARQHRAVVRTLGRLEPPGERLDLGDLALACALSYLDFRLPEIAWRQACPALAGWHDAVSHRPSMQETRPD